MTDQQQSLHWLDKLATGVLKWQEKNNIEHLHVDDMKTPSGRVHTGAIRGVMIHDLVAKVLQTKTSQPIVSTYVFNDMDSMDGLPSYLDKNIYEQHMGKPLYQIPKPELDTCGIDLSKATAEEMADFEKARNFAELYAFDFMHAFRKLGCDQEIVWSHELYESGKMDSAIRTALDKVDVLKKIYREVAEYELPEKWFPFQVICPSCGKVGTTLVTDWDGEQVTFECQPNKVTWAQGCGNTGKVSPFGGTGKLLWKVDWPAHWSVLGINIEGAGKDHTSAGGSRDMANAMCEPVFGIPVPFDMPYEWILIRGAKMSSSKGVGTSAREFTELFPAEVGRFLFVSRNYSQVIDFDPTTMAIPDLFDEYDQSARVYWRQESGDQRQGRAFELSQISGIPSAHFLPRFRDVATWMQHPELNLVQKFEEVKGSSLTKSELDELEQRKQYAQIWLDKYAPEEFQLTPKAELPEKAKDLTEEQRKFLVEMNTLVDSQDWKPEELQQALFDLAKSTLGAKQGFQAIYLAFLGKTAGPRAAWFVLNMDRQLRLDRVNSLISSEHGAKKYQPIYEDLTDSSLFSIDSSVQEKFPSVIVGVAVIKGIKVESKNEALQHLVNDLIGQYSHLSAKEIGDYPEIASYRQLYKETGVDWHSRRPSPEALLRRATQGKELYTINTCVDAYNYVVMKNRVSVGAFDVDTMQLPTVIKLAEGGEQATYIGDTEPTIINKGEICYFDQVGPYNLDLNYRDSIRTQVTENTTNILINVEGVYSINRQQVETSLKEVIEIVQRFCGGTVEFAGIVEAKK